MMEVESFSSPSTLSPECFDTSRSIQLPIFTVTWSMTNFSKAHFRKIMKSTLLDGVEIIKVLSQDLFYF